MSYLLIIAVNNSVTYSENGA